MKKRITIEVDHIVYELLGVLTKGKGAPQTIEGVLSKLVDHVQQGVYRPGAWERSWLEQAFGDDWEDSLTAGDPYGRPNGELYFQRPKND